MESCPVSEKRIAVVGGGPAGTSCAVQLKRSGFNPALYEEDRIGGTLHEAHRIENYPGFPDGITGSDLAQKLARSLDRWEVHIVRQRVEEIRQINDGIQVITNSGMQTFDHLVLATGTRPDTLDLGPEVTSELIHSSIRTVLERQPESVGIIGGGDAALDYAIHLSGFCRVHLVTRTGDLKGLPLLEERAKARGVTFHPGFSPSSVISQPDGIHLELNDETLNVSCLLTAIGRSPRDELDRDLSGPTIHRIGDLVNGSWRQAAIAAGNGLKTAMEIYASCR